MKRLYTITAHTMLLSEITHIEEALAEFAVNHHGGGRRTKEHPCDGGVEIEWQLLLDSEDCLNTPIVDAIRDVFDAGFTSAIHIQCRKVIE